MKIENEIEIIKKELDDIRAEMLYIKNRIGTLEMHDEKASLDDDTIY